MNNSRWHFIYYNWQTNYNVILEEKLSLYHYILANHVKHDWCLLGMEHSVASSYLFCVNKKYIIHFKGLDLWNCSITKIYLLAIRDFHTFYNVYVKKCFFIDLNKRLVHTCTLSKFLLKIDSSAFLCIQDYISQGPLLYC